MKVEAELGLAISVIAVCKKIQDEIDRLEETRAHYNFFY